MERRSCCVGKPCIGLGGARHNIYGKLPSNGRIEGILPSAEAVYAAMSIRLIAGISVVKKLLTLITSVFVLLLVALFTVGLVFADEDNKGATRRAGLEERLRIAVESGRITREAAEERIRSVREHVGSGDKDSYREIIAEKIQAAVDAGEMTGDEALEKLDHLMDGAEKKVGQRPWATIEEEVRRAVDTGDIARSEGDEKLEVIRDKFKDIRAIEQQIREAVDKGRMTRDEATEKIEDIRILKAKWFD